MNTPVDRRSSKTQASLGHSATAHTSRCRLVCATANSPGAIGIVQLMGECLPVLRAITACDDWPLHKLRLVDLAGIDSGIVVRLADDLVQLMPHGGPRVLQRLTHALIECGVSIIVDPFEPSVDPRQLYPEASDTYEALTLVAVARARSPLAIDLLMDQPRRWRQFERGQSVFGEQDQARSLRLNRLLDPPMVVLAGRPNVGKSTLSNALLGRSMSITLDMPGTTRDYTAGQIDLGGLVVDWHDTPGRRDAADPIERRAIEISERLIDRADLLIAMGDHELLWPDLPREPDLRIVNKIDQQERRVDPSSGDGRAAIYVSARTGAGIPTLVAGVRERLVPTADVLHDGPWLFDRRLLSEATSSGRNQVR